MFMTRPQFLVAFDLGIAFNHWWADAACIVVSGPAPIDASAQWAWAEACNIARADGGAAQAAWERYSRDPGEFVAALDATADEDTWACGGLYPPIPTFGLVSHRTGSHTLVWEISQTGSVTLTARRRGSSQPHTYILPDGSRHEGHAPGPDVWWRATVRASVVVVTATEAAPEPDSAQWDRDEAAWCQSGGGYTWGILTCAIRALGCTPPALPPMQPRRYAPPRGGARRSMSGVT